ncbi:MAG: class A beta-lactamase-related serine hydrolase [Brevundimonas sp.]|nr:MAG: class A beta-lactamase-related serine hydrolase [Brevundimonas sp.]
MKAHRVAAALIGWFIAGSAAADPIDDIVRGYMTAGHIPGVAVAVVDHGETRVLRTYGEANLEWEGAVTPDTPFQIASASKIFTGVLLMRLAEKGSINLDAPLTDIFPEAPAGWSEITFRRMASHSSGLPEGLGLPSTASPEDFVREAMTRPLAYEPGTESRYGLTDFVVMTAALEKVTGLQFPDLLKREVLDPLGLTSTGFDYATEGRPMKPTALRRRATTYVWGDNQQFEDGFLYPSHSYAAGGLYSSARDLATLFSAISKGEFLRPENFRALTTAARLKDGRPGEFAIGWTAADYRGEQVFGHSGGPALADILYTPRRDVTVIALTNQRQFFPLLAQSVADTLWPAPPPRPALEDDAPSLTQTFSTTLSAAGEARLNAESFNEQGRGSLDFLSHFGKALLGAVGPVESVDLLSDTPRDKGRKRVYRVRFERREMIWVATTDASGRFSELRPGSDSD